MRVITPLRIARLTALVATLSGALWLGSLAAENEAVSGLILQGGYLGVFLFSIINGFNVIVPMVTASFVPALTESGLNPTILILVMSSGMMIADSTAYFLGRLGHEHLSERTDRMTRSLVRAGERRHSLPLFMLWIWTAFVPLPTEIVAVPVGLMGYRARHVIPILMLGTLTFNSLVGFGVVSVVSWLG